MWSLFPQKSYKTLNQITIDGQTLVVNFAALSTYHPEAKICPVLKSNAYGHGLQQVAPIFDRLQPAFLVVDSLFEAYELSKLKVKTPILILGYTHPDNLKVKRLPFTFTVFDLETAEVLNRYQPGAKIHIFVDTGMNREGVKLDQLRSFVQQFKTLKQLQVEGLTSHFADADNPKTQAFSQQQIKNFKEALQILESEGISVKWRHLSASAGSFKYQDPTFNMIRAGLASYGIFPLETADMAASKIQLRPALHFYSTLAQIKHISKGEVVGYNGTYKAPKNMTLGLLPAGYYEGLDRRLSNKGIVSVNGVECPIVGRVSMNMTSIDISKVKNAQIGDEVCIYSANSKAKNSLTKAAQTAGTIPYELLVHLAESVKRQVI